MRNNTTNNSPRTALRAIADHSWQPRGRCHGMDPATADRLFFPGPRAHKAIARAKKLCGRCPVKQDCFNYALDNDLRKGLWGGLTEVERRPWHAKIKKRLDYARVHAALTGRDVHLSTPERNTVIRHAYLRGWSAESLAFLLQSNLDWMRDQLREAAHDIHDRDRYWDLYVNQHTDEDEEEGDDDEGSADEQDLDDDADADWDEDKDWDQDWDDEEDVEDEEGDDRSSSPVQRQVHTAELIAKLGKAA